jgi:TetR/AcrR family transcriptional regulator
MTKRRSVRRDSKAQIFAAAAAEFAEHGYAATSVDRIAAKARVNKAMLYYHFGSKADLYREVLQDMFRALAARARAIADGNATPSAKFDTWVATIVEEASARPHFPPIMLRELASGGDHLDADTFRIVGGIYAAVRDIIGEGQSTGEFRALNPLLVHFTVIPTVIFFLARQRAVEGRRAKEEVLGPITREEFVGHIQDVARRMLRQET